MKVVEFVDQGAIFTFQKRTMNVFVRHEDKPKAWPVDRKYKNTFKESGYVMNYSLESREKESPETFGYELRVRFTSEHVISAGNITKLRLGINFSMTDNDWKDITPASDLDKIYEPFGKWQGYFRVIIKGGDATNREGGDPVVGWGP